MELEKELIETALRRHGQAGTVERVISMEAESALPKGENYLSTIYRISLRVVLGNGRTAKRSLILKVVPSEKAKIELVKNMGVFKSETMMYTVVLKEMEMLMEEFGDTNDVLWCRLLHYEPYTSLLLEDLKASGFKMTRRQDCLDLDHALLVLRSLGRFHAMSKILEQRGVISKDDYKPYSLVSDKNLIKFFMYYGLQTLAKAMEEHWGPEWYDVAQKLKVPCEVLQEKMLKLGELDESRFNCLNHGDCWSNNMMFKYDWQNRPFTMRFVDFQMSHYGPSSWDVAHALRMILHPKTLHENLDLLVRTYVGSLRDALAAYGHIATPDEADVRHGMDRTGPFSRLVSFVDRGLMLSEAEEPLDWATFVATESREGMDPEVFTNPRYRDLIGPDIKDFVQEGYIEKLFFS